MAGVLNTLAPTLFREEQHVKEADPSAAYCGHRLIWLRTNWLFHI